MTSPFLVFVAKPRCQEVMRVKYGNINKIASSLQAAGLKVKQLS